MLMRFLLQIAGSLTGVIFVFCTGMLLEKIQGWMDAREDRKMRQKMERQEAHSDNLNTSR